MSELSKRAGVPAVTGPDDTEYLKRMTSVELSAGNAQGTFGTEYEV